MAVIEFDAMACYFPIHGYRAKRKNPSGKYSIVFNRKDGYVDLPVDVPCGQCIGCRLERSRQWAVRCLHEAKLHDQSCFLTLTYSPENLPQGGTLVKKHMQDFFKRFRKNTGIKLRYFYCGEYGEQLSRPHYHAIVYGYDFPDKSLIRGGEFPLYRSDSLAALWPFGFSSIGAVTFESAAYVARYVTKKVTGEKAADHYGDRLPEYVDMSRRPGIGRDFALQYKDEILRSDSVISRGIEMRPPRFYDKIYDVFDIDSKNQLEKNKTKRLLLARQLKQADPDPLRPPVIAEVKELKLKNNSRSYENG